MVFNFQVWISIFCLFASQYLLDNAVFIYLLFISPALNEITYNNI